MCGIVGFADKTKRIEILEKMVKIQKHREPDDSGIYFDAGSGVHLGHKRLAIQDLSLAGHQPMESSCGGYVIVFNGEIYNFKDIRKQLKAKGYKFKSNSDTEVVLYSYKEKGVQCAKDFIGMFAIAIFDRIRNKIVLIRDRAGIKPLYYYWDGNLFMFSSEIKTFHFHPNFHKDINIQVLPYYFQFGYIPSDRSIFKYVHKLDAGCYLEFNLNDLSFKIKTLSPFLCKFLFHLHHTKSHLTFQSFPGRKYKAGDKLETNP